MPFFVYPPVEPIYDDAGDAYSEVTLRIDAAELDRLLAAYDPNSGTSPAVADCRPLVRAILDAIVASRNPQ